MTGHRFAAALLVIVILSLNLVIACTNPAPTHTPSEPSRPTPTPTFVAPTATPLSPTATPSPTSSPPPPAPTSGPTATPLLPTPTPTAAPSPTPTLLSPAPTAIQSAPDVVLPPTANDCATEYDRDAFGSYPSGSREYHNDHHVALAEAWRSGACRWPSQRLNDFANYPVNLRLIPAGVNLGKSDKDPAEWNYADPDAAHWYANCAGIHLWIQVKNHWELSSDAAESRTLHERASCAPGELATAPTPTHAPPVSTPTVDVLRYDTNGNGRITCSEARAAGIAPVRRGDPAYPYMDDRDGDGVVCE